MYIKIGPTVFFVILTGTSNVPQYHSTTVRAIDDKIFRKVSYYKSG